MYLRIHPRVPGPRISKSRGELVRLLCRDGRKGSGHARSTHGRHKWIQKLSHESRGDFQCRTTATGSISDSLASRGIRGRPRRIPRSKFRRKPVDSQFVQSIRHHSWNTRGNCSKLRGLQRCWPWILFGRRLRDTKRHRWQSRSSGEAGNNSAV